MEQTWPLAGQAWPLAGQAWPLAGHTRLGPAADSVGGLVARDCGCDEGMGGVPELETLQSDGLEVFARRSKNAAAAAEYLPDVLLSHLPPDPRELATGSRLATGAFLAGGHSLLRCPASAVILSSISMAWFCRLNPACGVSMFHGMWSMSIRRR